MAIPLLGALVEPVTRLVEKTLDKIAVDKNVKLQVMSAVKISLERFVHEEGMAFEERVMAELDKPNWFRDAVRPIITYTAWGLYCFIKGITIYIATKVYFPMLLLLTKGTAQEVFGRSSEIRALLSEYVLAIWSEWDVWILVSIVMFWFGPKAFERLRRTGKQVIGQKDSMVGGLVGMIKGWVIGSPKSEGKEQE